MMLASCLSIIRMRPGGSETKSREICLESLIPSCANVDSTCTLQRIIDSLKFTELVNNMPFFLSLANSTSTTHQLVKSLRNQDSIRFNPCFESESTSSDPIFQNSNLERVGVLLGVIVFQNPFPNYTSDDSMSYSPSESS